MPESGEEIKSGSRLKRWLKKLDDSPRMPGWAKKLGLGVVLFFVIKGIITSTLIIWCLITGASLLESC